MAHKITMNKNLAYTESLQQCKIHLLLLAFKINKNLITLVINYLMLLYVATIEVDKEQTGQIPLQTNFVGNFTILSEIILKFLFGNDNYILITI